MRLIGGTANMPTSRLGCHGRLCLTRRRGWQAQPALALAGCAGKHRGCKTEQGLETCRGIPVVLAWPGVAEIRDPWMLSTPSCQRPSQEGGTR